MKLTKRILVVAVMIAVLISAFAFTTSAEFTEDNIDDVLEYEYPKYIEEDFNSEKLGGYCYPLHHSVTVTAKTSRSVISGDVKDPANKYIAYQLLADNLDNGYFGYNFEVNGGVSEAVFTTKVFVEKSSAAITPSYSINISAYDKLGNPVGESSLVTPITVNFQTGEVYCAKVNSADSSLYTSSLVDDIDFSITTETWYTVTLLINAEAGTYKFSIESENGDIYESSDISIGDAKYITELNSSFATLPASAGAICAMDDVKFYQGTMIRGDENIGEMIDWALVGIAGLIEEGNLTVEQKIRIIEVYDAIFRNGYVPTDADVLVLFESAKLYRAETNTEFFCSAVQTIDSGKSYARRQDKLLELAEYFPVMNGENYYIDSIALVISALESKVAADYNASASVLAAGTPELEALNAVKAKADAAFAAYRESFRLKADMSARIAALDAELSALGAQFTGTNEYRAKAIGIITENENTLAALRVALAAYNAELKRLDEVKKDSEGFINYMKTYNPDSRDYTYILDAYAQIAQFKFLDNSYNYANNSPDCVFYYIPMYEALEKKIDEMNAAIGAFRDALAIMKDESAGFDTRFNVGYVSAKLAYNNGKLYEGVDVSTVPELANDIEEYLAIEASFSTTIQASENFIKTVDTAMFNTLYETKKAALAEAKLLLANDANINEAYPGVKEAKAKIETVENDIKVLEDSAAAYIAAVAEIGKQTTFNAKKAAVDKAVSLQAAGNVVGFFGVAEANGALVNYSAEIQILEGNSKTFIDSVNKLDNEELTLAERRALILVADGVKSGAEPTYDGVTEAIEALASYKEEYKASVEAINSAFAGEISNVSAIAGASANQSRYYPVMELIKLIIASFK